MPVARTLRLSRFPVLALWLSGVLTCAMPAIAAAFPGVAILGPTRGPTYETTLPSVTLSGEVYELDPSVISGVTWSSDRVTGGGTIPFTPPVSTWMGGKVSTWTAENIPLVLGVNTITITATNDGGYTAWKEIVVTRTDTPPPGLPSIEITGPSTTGSYAASEREVSITGKADDPGGGVTRVSWSSDRIPGSLEGCGFEYPASHVTWNCTAVLMAGVNTIRVIATDYDNQTAEATIVITVTDPPVAPGTPVVHITSPVPGPNGVFVTGRAVLKVDATMSDPDGVLAGILYRATFPGFLLSDSVGTPPPSSFNWSRPDIMLRPGVNHITVSAFDGDGHTGTDTLVVFRDPAAPTGPPTVSITSPTSSGSLMATSTTIKLSGVASDPDDNIYMYWDSDRFPQNDTLYTPANNVRVTQVDGQATWTSSDIPLAAGVNHITVTAQDGVSSTTASITVTLNELTYYLAEGATGFFTYDLLLGNPNDVEAPITIQFLDQNGPLAPLTRVLPAKSRTTIRVNDLPGMDGRSISTVVTSTAALPLMVERTMFWDSRAYGAATDHASEAMSTTWYFAEGAQGFFRTYILLANPHPTANVAHVTYFREGVGPITRDYPLKAWARDTIDIGTEPELRFQAFGTEVTFEQPGVAERAMYFGGPPQWLGGHESAGVTEPSLDWFLAEGATGDYWVTFALFANPSATETAHVDVSYLRPSGEPVTKRYDIAPQQRRSFNIAAQDPLLASTAVATEVHSDIPIIVERAQYWGGHSPTQWLESHNSFGVTVPSTKWGLAEGRIGGPSKFQSYILIANPGFIDANVTVTFLREDGKPAFAVGPFVVNEKSRRTVFGDVPVPNFADENFSAVITSDRPIVVERAMYSDALGQHWKAGTNATGVRLP